MIQKNQIITLILSSSSLESVLEDSFLTFLCLLDLDFFFDFLFLDTTLSEWSLVELDDFDDDDEDDDSDSTAPSLIIKSLSSEFSASDSSKLSSSLAFFNFFSLVWAFLAAFRGPLPDESESESSLSLLSL